ncbi:hypothetical protein M3P05_14970 [Sansalvadorimonas sp. 2012CJ34-2]|uniref:Phage-related protein n=1 Tax=Parendozoicomonas callyspongiae TaxID=2942213 RepID=A0ABT0PJS5_9GAMM|nr:hypothetical protein [Sansalvadorimonas sp. 2012CJ34-2]MCL6271226.1 hypothetical protein [Sansalvadorimonas sp. 2012CJ34-2]
MPELEEFYVGERFTVLLTRDGKTSWEELVKTYGQTNKKGIAALLVRIRKYADKGVLHTPDQLNNEGDGFWAIKTKCGFRFYWWFDAGQKMIGSHFILKKRQKLAPADSRRMHANRSKYDADK